MSDGFQLAMWIVLGIIGFFATFPLTWIFVVWLIGTVGGWGKLAKRYRAPQSAQQNRAGHQWLSQYGFVNGSRYGSALNLTAQESGLLLEVVQLFRINHPPLFIPWQELHSPKLVNFRNHELVELQVGHPAFATVRLPLAFVEQSGAHKLIHTPIGTNVPAS